MRPLLLIALVLVVGLSGCRKCKDEIPDTYMTDDQLAWIPFNGSETVVFEDSSGNELTLTASGYINVPPTVDKRNCADEDSGWKGLLFSSDGYTYEIGYDLRFWPEGYENKEVGLALSLIGSSETCCSMIYGDNKAYLNTVQPPPDYATKTINSRNFTNVYEFHNKNVKVYYTKQLGVVGFEEDTCCDPPNMHIWNLK